MEIGKRYGIRHDLGGGGWERDGFLGWNRMINGKEYTFQITWDPDNRTPGGMKYMWGWRIHAYTMVGATKKGIYTYPVNYHQWAWKGYPTGGIDKDRPVERKRIPKTWYTGIMDREQLDDKVAALNKQADEIRAQAEKMQADWEA